MKKLTQTYLKAFVLMGIYILFSSQVLLAQSGLVKGVISDKTGNQIPDVNIIVIGTNLGTTTDFSGKYLLSNVPLGKQVFKISSIGYDTMEVTLTIVEGVTLEKSYALNENQFSLNEVIVTASRRSEKIQDLALAISAISSKGIEEMGVTDTRDYLETLPGLYVNSTSPGVNTVTLRGISPMGGWANSVGYYLGETPLPFLPAISSFDVERIEVLRGPQGTLYGEGSMGGTIKIIPKAASTDRFEAMVNPEISSTKGGGFNYIVNGMINLPIIKDKLAVRATGFYQNDDGFIENIGLGIDNVNTFENFGGRISAKYFATDKLMFTASAIFNKSKNGGKFVATEDYLQTTTVAERGSQNYNAYTFTADYDFSFANLTVTGSYYNDESTDVQDLAGLLPDVNYILSLGGIEPRTEVWTDGKRSSDTYSAEARLVSSNEGPLKWTTGLFYKDFSREGTLLADTEAHLDSQVISDLMEFGLGIPGVTELYDDLFTVDIKQLSFFGEVSYDISPKLNMLVGLRLMNEKRNFSAFTDGMFPILASGLAPELREEKGDENVLNPKFVISYKPSNNVLLYANASKGFRSGGQNLYTFFYPGTKDTYDSESLWNYEFGLKSSLFDGKLIANAAVFYNDWTDMQVITRSKSDFNLNENVGKAHTTGVDFELTWLPVRGLLISAAGNYIKAETDVAIITPAGLDPNTGEELFNTVPAGTQLENIPEFSYNFAAQYKFALSENTSLVPRIDYNYKGANIDYYIDMLNPIDIPSYGLTNFRLSLERKGLSVYAFVNNLTNEKVINGYYIDSPTLGNIYKVGRPQTIGLGLRIKI